MVPQEDKRTPKEKMRDATTLQEKIAAVTKIPHRTDGGRKLKNPPKEIKEALIEAEKKEKVPRKVTKKQIRKDERKKKKGTPPPNCRYVEGIECIFAGDKWLGQTIELKERDRLNRPRKNVFCKQVCLSLVMAKHQTVSMFSIGVTLTKQMAQIVGALNVLAQQAQPAPQIAVKKHPNAPATSLREMREEPEINIEKPDK
jgi:hypothetical protein